MTKKATPPKDAPPTRLRTLLEGLGFFAASLVAGVAILAVIGLIPGHQEKPLLQPVLTAVSLAMFAGLLWGAWLVLKAICGMIAAMVRRVCLAIIARLATR